MLYLVNISCKILFCFSICLVFFLSCVIAELFCEGNPLFDLSQLLAYKNGDYSPEVKLSKIDNNIKVIGMEVSIIHISLFYISGGNLGLYFDGHDPSDFLQKYI